MYILGFWSEVGGAIVDALRSLMLSLCGIIYKLIIFFFDIFMKLGNAQLLEQITISEFYERVSLLLGLFMIFRVTFSLVQYVINPDMMTDKNKGVFNIVKRLIVVVILLGVTRPIFSMAYDVQREIIESNVIPKVITGKNINASASGAHLAWYTFSSFYSFNDNVIKVDSNAIAKCPEFRGGQNSSLLKADFLKNSSLNYAYNCVNHRVEFETIDGAKVEDYLINFDGHGIIAVITGALILWMILTYTLQVAIRVVQLAYLQLIAPVPIISYLAPKGEDTLNKWVKQCVTTYIDFFIRIAILYFVIFIINLIISNDYTIFVESLGDTSRLEMEFINVIVIIALLVFANKVPKLLKEIFPSFGGSGAASFDFGLNPKKTLNNTLAASLIGGAVGAVGAGASNAVHGYMNVKKAFKNNGGITSGKAWKTAAGAAGKGIFSIVGGQVGGAVAGLKTKDITKSGEAIKTANKNRAERELRAEAGYHWYNPLPVMEDKILEFSGDRSAEDIKKRQSAMRDAKRYEEQLRRGEQVFNMVDGELADKEGNVKSGVFHNAEYVATLTAKNKSKKAVKEASAEVKTAEREVIAVYNNHNLTGEDRKRAIEVAELKLKNAEGNLKAAEGKLKIDEEKHAKNQEIYSDDKEIESLFNYYADTHKGTKKLDDGVDKLVEKYEQEDFERSMQAQVQAEMEQMKKEENDILIQEEIARREKEDSVAKDEANIMQDLYDKLHGVKAKSASENGAPTEAFSAIAEKYKKEDEMKQAEIKREVQERLEAQRRAEISQGLREAESGVVEQIGYGPKITAENSIFVKLAEEAKQEQEERKQREMQEEFKNRINNDSNN